MSESSLEQIVEAADSLADDIKAEQSPLSANAIKL